MIYPRDDVAEIITIGKEEGRFVRKLAREKEMPVFQILSLIVNEYKSMLQEKQEVQNG